MLFLKECKKVLFSLTFVLYVIAMLAMYFTQFNNDADVIPVPRPGEKSYGTIAKESPEVMMPAAVERLVSSYLQDSYPAYPFGFYKNVHLREKQKSEMAEIITEVSGITKNELDAFTDFQEGMYIMDENGAMVYQEPNLPAVSIPDSLTYERFRELMRKADKIIGGGSEYSDDYIVENFSRVPKTYEDALYEYNQIIEEDKITGAYARLYCDYMGIMAAILPIFVAVSFTGLDRKSRMEQLAYSRKISSAKLILTRYGALVLMMVLPILITALMAHFKVIGLYPDNEPDSFAMLKGAVTWVVPNVMLAAAMGMFLTEFVSGLTAIFVQGAWWVGSIFAGTASLTGNMKSLTLVLRHNSLFGLDAFVAEHDIFVFNRLFYTVFSLVIVILTILCYEQKRRGGFYGLRSIWQNFNRKPKA